MSSTKPKARSQATEGANMNLNKRYYLKKKKKKKELTQGKGPDLDLYCQE